MKTEIKILHLYYDFLNLYGEYGNVKILERSLLEQGVGVRVDKISLFEKTDFNKYDFIYIGSGTEEKLISACKDLTECKADIVSAAKNGTMILATGNSFEMFGEKIIMPDKKEVCGLNYLNIKTVIDGDVRFLEDCICRARFLDTPCVGFINRAGEIFSKEKPMFISEFGVGNSLSDKSEGVIKDNFYGTALTGPCLVKNPHLLMYFVGELLQRKGGKAKDTISFEQKLAYEITYNALNERKNRK